MAPIVKFIVGIAGTSLIATAAFKLSRAPLLSGLGSRTAEVMIANGITDGRANWVTPAGWTYRVARLSGTADAPTRARTQAAVAALTGVNDALWEDETGGAAPVAAANLGECRVRLAAIVASQPIGFGASDATITRASQRQVDAIAQVLQRCPAQPVEIIGHTALTATTAINLALSKARADAVATALAERGVTAERIATTGRGNLDRSEAAAIEIRVGSAPARQEPRS